MYWHLPTGLSFSKTQTHSHTHEYLRKNLYIFVGATLFDEQLQRHLYLYFSHLRIGIIIIIICATNIRQNVCQYLTNGCACPCVCVSFHNIEFHAIHSIFSSRSHSSLQLIHCAAIRFDAQKYNRIPISYTHTHSPIHTHTHWASNRLALSRRLTPQNPHRVRIHSCKK